MAMYLEMDRDNWVSTLEIGYYGGNPPTLFDLNILSSDGAGSIRIFGIQIHKFAIDWWVTDKREWD
jgi:hypothetical protein